MKNSFFDEILSAKRKEVEELKQVLPARMLERRFRKGRQKPRSFSRAITAASGIRLIAELKKASPSAGVIVSRYNPAALAHTYEKAGASAVSVLTERQYFLGRPSHISVVKRVVGIPVLRKDFLLDPYQVLESAVLEADAALLIVAVLGKVRLGTMLKEMRNAEIEALVEVHTERELDIALGAGAGIIGINNRNLKTMKVDMETSARLIRLIPEGVSVVAESGFETHKELTYLADLGIHAFLVGTSVLKAENISEKIGELLGTT